MPVLTRNLKHAVPPDSEDALAALYATGGTVVEVTDAEALAAQLVLARVDGIFAEPSATVGLVAVRKLAAAGLLRPADTVVAVVTGSGLREIGAATEHHRPAIAPLKVRDALAALSQ